MKISPQKFLLFAPLVMFFIAGGIWFLILAQSVSFFTGLLLLIFFFFLFFWRGLLISRKAGELFGIKNKKYIFLISIAATLGFAEIVWVISFLPFHFFVLGGIFTVIFSISFDILKEYFKRRPGIYADVNPDFKRFEKILIRDIVGAVIFIIIFISIGPWLPRY